MRARVRAFVQDGEREPYVAAGVAPLGAHGPAEIGEQCVHAPLTGARTNQETMDAAAVARLDDAPRAAKDEQSIALPADRAERSKRAAVAVVRRRGQQNDVRRARGECGDGFVPVAVVGQTMRFVDDDIPRA